MFKSYFSTSKFFEDEGIKVLRRLSLEDSQNQVVIG